MNATIAASLVRHVLTAAGGGLAVSWGLDGQVWEGVVGVLAALTGLGWSIYDKRKQ